MSHCESRLIKNFFSARSRNITPVPMCHAAHVLYAPVSKDPEITRVCASILSKAEQQRAERFTSHSDSLLFIQRRAFRRFCGALSLGSSKPLSQVVFEETENGRPYLAKQPSLWFSFSSCRFGFLGAWSSKHQIGVDIEDQTRDPGPTQIARQFFSEAEASAVEGDAGLANLQSFFQLWSLKEAALKSIGEGIPYGLSAFEFELDPRPRVVHAPPDHGGPGQFSAQLIEGTGSCAAMVIQCDVA